MQGTAIRRVWSAVTFGVLALAAMSLVPVSAMAKPDTADAVQVFSGDVFEIVGSTLRHPTSDTSAEAPLFNNAGVSLETTWGEWQQASAESRVTEHGGSANPRSEVRLSLSGLRPGGVYSVFYGTLGPDSENPLCPGVERTLALPAVKPAANAPDASSFIASESGTADFRGAIDGHLFDATQVFFSIVYHFDGSTYGALPNRGEFFTQGSNCRSSFGEDAMRHLLVLQKW